MDSHSCFNDNLGQSVLSVLNVLSTEFDKLSFSKSAKIDCSYFDQENYTQSNFVDSFDDLRSQEDANCNDVIQTQFIAQTDNDSNAHESVSSDTDEIPAVPGNVFEEDGIFEPQELIPYDDPEATMEGDPQTICNLNSFCDGVDSTGSQSDSDSREMLEALQCVDHEEEPLTEPVLHNPRDAVEHSFEDEWENDDDTGYIIISISTDDFLEMDEEAAAQRSFEEEVKEEIVDWVSKSGCFVDSQQPEKESINLEVSGGTWNASEMTPQPSSGVESQDNFETKQSSLIEKRRMEIMGQNTFIGADKVQHSFFNLKVIFEPFKTGFEETKHFDPPKGTIIAGRYEVSDFLGQAAFSSALQCVDLCADEGEAQWVCLKVIKNSKDFFDQSMDEIKLLQYINSKGDPNKHHVLQLIDFFYCKEHLFIVSELLRENLYEFGRYVKESGLEPYYTIPRLKKIVKQVLEALEFIHSLNLVHCDIKPENIVIKSYSRCEVKLIDFGSSCFTSDHLSTYIQSRSYRAPEVIIGHHYDARIDIWSVGAVLAELHTGYVLFQNDSVATMLARITGILGPFPPHVLAAGRETRKYFTVAGVCYERVEDVGYSLIYPKKTSLAARLHVKESGDDDAHFVDFVRQSLNLDPVKRPQAKNLLAHPWLQGADDLKIPVPVLSQPPPAPADFTDDLNDGESSEASNGNDLDEETEDLEESECAVEYEEGEC